jgi:periplasmic divalent cation tolerance protein
MTDKRIVLTTAGSEEEARKIAHALVERRLAACVNIVPQIASIYRWQGKVEEAREWLLIAKTTFAAFAQVRDAIAELHSYDVPGIHLPQYRRRIAELLGMDRGIGSRGELRNF